MVDNELASASFLASSAIDSREMFYGCGSLLGGNGTVFDASHVDAEYARIDAEGVPGYFICKECLPPVEPAINISGADVELASTTFVYDGTAKKPAVKVLLDGKELVASTDFTLDYSSNVNVGAAMVTVAGKGRYEGAKSATFAIKPASVTAVAISNALFTYNGQVHKPGVGSVNAGSLVLKPSDYTIEYSNASSTVAGTYTVTVAGKGNFAGSKFVTYKIAKASNKAAVAKTAVKKTLKAKSLKKKAATVALPKVTASFGAAKWSVAKKDGKKVLKLKNGKIVAKKGAKKGTYTITLKATVAGTQNYAAASSKPVVVKVRVK